MKYFIIFLMFLACVSANLLPKLTLHFPDEDDDPLGLFSKPNLFEKLFKKKEKFDHKLEEKLEKLMDLKEEKGLKKGNFEEQLLGLLDDKPKAKLVHDKLAEAAALAPPPPPPPPPAHKPDYAAYPPPPPPPPPKAAPPPPAPEPTCPCPEPAAPAPAPTCVCRPANDCEYYYFT